MKIVIIALQSMDGYLAQSIDDDLSWGSSKDKDFFKARTKAIGTMIMGSTTFNTMKDIKNGIAFRNRRCLVFTSKPEDYANYITPYAQVDFFKGTPLEAVNQLEKSGVKEAAVIGGGKLIQQFLNAGLVDEVYITIAPVVFGSGIKMCDGKVDQIKMQLLEQIKLSVNEFALHYKVIKDQN